MRCEGWTLPQATLRRLISIAESTRDRLEAGDSPDALWTLALLDLTTRPRDAAVADRAIARLVEVVARDSGSGAAFSHLAIAHLVRGQAPGASRSGYDALDAIQRAKRIDSSSSAIRFNHALVLERVGLCHTAAMAWRAYLAIDSITDWAREVRARLGGCRKSLVGSWRLRESVFDSLIPAWSEAVVLSAAPSADRILARIEEIGRVLVTGHGDSLVVRTATALRERTVGPGGSSIIAGLRTAARGGAAFSRGAYEAARPDLDRAVHLLKVVSEPALWSWPSLQLGAVDLVRGDYARAESRFLEVRRAAESARLTFLLARAASGLGLSSARQGRMAQAEAWYAAAAAHSDTLGDLTGWGFVQIQLSEIYTLLGQQDRSWAAAAGAIAALRDGEESRYLHSALLSAGMRLSDAGLPHAAVAVLEEDVLVADSTGRPQDITEALARLGDAALRAQDDSSARRAMARARLSLARVSDPLMRERMEVEIARVEAHTEGARGPRLSLDRLEMVARYFDRQGIGIALPPILAMQAENRLALGDTSGAERTLLSALQLLETRARTTSNRFAATGVLEGEASVYRGLVALALSRGDTGDALHYAQRANPDIRARPKARLGMLPPQRAVLQYLALDDRLLIWAMTTNGMRLSESRVTRGQLDGLVDRLVLALERSSGSAVTQGLAGELYDLLIAPIASAIAGAKELAIIPDRLLQRLPFAPLIDRATGRYLVEDFLLRQIGDLAAARDGKRVPRTEGSPIVIAGNPDFDPALFPGLRSLSHAKREAESVAGLYPGSQRLGGRGATRSVLLRGLGNASLFHFAGHARSLEGAADRSHLVLAAVPGNVGDNVLYGDEIARLDLRTLRLAVLSACGTGERVTGAGGLSSLAQAFVAAGAQGVISSLWQVDDAETAGLMVDLHRALIAGAAPPAALRQAQLAAIAREREHSRSPGSWAAFRYEGN